VYIVPAVEAGGGTVECAPNVLSEYMLSGRTGISLGVWYDDSDEAIGVAVDMSTDTGISLGGDRCCANAKSRETGLDCVV
jgi:hypothetical protein